MCVCVVECNVPVLAAFCRSFPLKLFRRCPRRGGLSAMRTRTVDVRARKGRRRVMGSSESWLAFLLLTTRDASASNTTSQIGSRTLWHHPLHPRLRGETHRAHLTDAPRKVKRARGRSAARADTSHAIYVSTFYERRRLTTARAERAAQRAAPIANLTCSVCRYCAPCLLPTRRRLWIAR